MRAVIRRTGIGYNDEYWTLDRIWSSDICRAFRYCLREDVLELAEDIIAALNKDDPNRIYDILYVCFEDE